MRTTKENLIIGINLGDYGSTGGIMLSSLEYAYEHGPFDVLALIPYKTKRTNKVRTISFAVRIPIYKKIVYWLLRKMRFPIMNDGNYYSEYTNSLIGLIAEKSKDYKKTFIHLHNLHSCKLNVNKLYKWLGKHDNFKVLYTLHDCWAYTGGCYYYSHIPCDKWKSDCKKCPLGIKYASYQLKKKTKLLNKMHNILIMPVSNWADLEIKKSLISKLESKVNHGETSLHPFGKPTDLKKTLNIQDKKVLLLVSAYWNEWKGTKYVYELAKKIPKSYVLLIVGNFDNTGYDNIVVVRRVSHDILNKYYEIADVYVSVTQAEQLGLTTCEAQICGIPVVGFGNGGSKETFIDGKTGYLVENNNLEQMVNAIKYVIDRRPFDENVIKENGNLFGKNQYSKRQFGVYLDLLSS